MNPRGAIVNGRGRQACTDAGTTAADKTDLMADEMDTWSLQWQGADVKHASIMIQLRSLFRQSRILQHRLSLRLMQGVLARVLVILVIAGMLAQMALMALSRPGEVPRAALERLTGLLLTDPVNVPTDASLREGDCLDASHEADMSVTVPHELMVHMHHGGHVQRDHDQPGHDQHQACSICVFLAMAAALLVMPVLPPLSSGIWVRIVRRVMQPRAPPGSGWLSAYARGPPVPA